MASNCSAQLGAARALVDLMRDHQQLGVLEWTLTPVGVLLGQQTAVEGRGEIIAECARVLGGTPVSVRADVDGSGFAELVTVWRGVNVKVWVTYSVPAPPRALGTVVPAGGGR
ncbi:hypothetical protein [[Kitasatospora] papulosa]|uniref:hypothetical protein n=1 Tax=[Kitasatospora] papulosa TaxID=1464011 RepID=UPI003681832C